MKKQSAGLLVYRQKDRHPEVLIAHMGSPWWAKKDKGAWTIPKGEYEEGEDPQQTAKREFREELGQEPPEGELIELGTIEQKNKKIVIAWGVEGDMDVSEIQSNTFTMEWPPRSGKTQEFPEIDRAQWMSPETAAEKLIPEQVPLLERLARKLEVQLDSKQIAEQPEQGSLF